MILDSAVREELPLSFLSDHILGSGIISSYPFVYEDYHGFSKALLPSEVIGDLPCRTWDKGSSSYIFVPSRDMSLYRRMLPQVQVEVVRVNSDLSDQVHIHEKAYACCTILGSRYAPDRFEAPRDAFFFAGNEWKPMGIIERVSIPAGSPHGFTVAPSGILNFLSVQAPPIVDAHGRDDYRVVPAPLPPYKVKP